MFAPVSGPWDGGQGKSFENPSIIMRNGPGRKSRTKSCGRFPPMLYSSHIFEKKEGDHVEAGSADVLRGRKINFGKIQNFFGKGVTNRGPGTLYRVEGVGVRRWRPIPRGRWPSSDPAHAGPPSPQGKALDSTIYHRKVQHIKFMPHQRSLPMGGRWPRSGRMRATFRKQSVVY